MRNFLILVIEEEKRESENCTDLIVLHDLKENPATRRRKKTRQTGRT